MKQFLEITVLTDRKLFSCLAYILCFKRLLLFIRFICAFFSTICSNVWTPTEKNVENLLFYILREEAKPKPERQRELFSSQRTVLRATSVSI